MKQITIELDEALIAEAERIAQQRGSSLTEVIDYVLGQYVDSVRRQPILAIAGMFSFPDSSTPEDLDRELMEGLDPVEGWSHDPPAVPDPEPTEAQRAS